MAQSVSFLPSEQNIFTSPSSVLKLTGFNPVFDPSDDFTIALWLKRELTSDPWVEPRAVSVLRGHNGGVTCLAFSPTGDQLLSGGKDKVQTCVNTSQDTGSFFHEALFLMSGPEGS